MFEDIKLRYEIYKIEKKINNTTAFYYKLADKAEKEKKPNGEIQSIHAELNCEIRADTQNLNFLKSKFLTQKASRLDIVIPEHTDKKYWDNHNNHYFWLSQNGRQTVTKLIRNEQKERRDAWIPIVSVLIGLMGTLVAVIALIKD